MSARPDTGAMRTWARCLPRLAEELQHDATVARRSVSRLEHRWVGGAAVQHAGAVGDYVRGIGNAVVGLREAAQQTAATAAQLDRELADLTRLEIRSAALGVTGPALYDAEIEQVRTRIAAHRLHWVRALAQIDLQGDPGRRMHCGPARRRDLGPTPGPRVRTGPVRPIVEAWSGGSGGHQPVAVHRSVIAP